MGRRNYQKHYPAPLPSTIKAQPRNVTFLTIKTVVSEKSLKRRAHVLGQGSVSLAPSPDIWILCLRCLSQNHHSGPISFVICPGPNLN